MNRTLRITAATLVIALTCLLPAGCNGGGSSSADAASSIDTDPVIVDTADQDQDSADAIESGYVIVDTGQDTFYDELGFIIAQPHDLEDRQKYEISKAVSEGIPTVFLASRNSLTVANGFQSGYPIEFMDPSLDDYFRTLGIQQDRNR